MQLKSQYDVQAGSLSRIDKFIKSKVRKISNDNN